MTELYPLTIALVGRCLSTKKATSAPKTNCPANCKLPMTALTQPTVETKFRTRVYEISDETLRNTSGDCATTKKPSDSAETCALGDSAILKAPIETKIAYHTNAVALISSTPARKAAIVRTGKMKRLSGN